MRIGFMPIGRISELHSREDAGLLAYTIGQSLGDGVCVVRYASRMALEAFCKAGSRHHAVVKRAVPATMLTNRNTQRVED